MTARRVPLGLPAPASECVVPVSGLSGQAVDAVTGQPPQMDNDKRHQHEPNREESPPNLREMRATKPVTKNTLVTLLHLGVRSSKWPRTMLPMAKIMAVTATAIHLGSNSSLLLKEAPVRKDRTEGIEPKPQVGWTPDLALCLKTVRPRVDPNRRLFQCSSDPKFIKRLREQFFHNHPQIKQRLAAVSGKARSVHGSDCLGL